MLIDIATAPKVMAKGSNVFAFVFMQEDFSATSIRKQGKLP
jgi:hypothetical protein